MPARLGKDFRWLLSSSIVNNAGDGIVLAAGPLLVASQTNDPFVVSLALLFGYVPFLIFGVIGGAAADRFDRRRMVIVANVARAVVLAVLVVTIVTGTVSIPLILGAIFLLGTAETFADSASSTLVPSMVAREDLGIANARMQGPFILLNQLVGPPIGAFMFAVGMALRSRPTRQRSFSARFSLRGSRRASERSGGPARVRAAPFGLSWSRACAGLPTTRQCARWP